MGQVLIFKLETIGHAPHRIKCGLVSAVFLHGLENSHPTAIELH